MKKNSELTILIVIILYIFQLSCRKDCSLSNLTFQETNIAQNEINISLRGILYTNSEIHGVDPEVVFEVHNNSSNEIINLKNEINSVQIFFKDNEWDLVFLNEDKLLLKKGHKIFISMFVSRKIMYDYRIKLIDFIKEDLEAIKFFRIDNKNIKHEISVSDNFFICLK